MNIIATITITEALKKEIDNIRGDIPRSKFIVQILEKSLLDFRQTKSKIEERLMINRVFNMVLTYLLILIPEKKGMEDN